LKKFPVVLACLFASFVEGSLVAQVSITQIKLTHPDDWVSVSFPRVAHANPSVADSINATLQQELLMNERLVDDTVAMFANTRYELTDSSSNPGYTHMEFVESMNNERVFSIFFQLEYTSAYPESYQQYFNFDLTTGRRLAVEDLFTEAGIKQISKRLIDERKKRIASWIKDMRLENEAEDSAWVRQSFEEPHQFLLTTEGILFYKGYCFPHVARSYDTDLDVLIPYQSLSRYLHEEGRKILSFLKK
jgi:hypothetical protein